MNNKINVSREALLKSVTTLVCCTAISTLTVSCADVCIAPQSVFAERISLSELPYPDWGKPKLASYEEILDRENKGSKKTELFIFEENPKIYVLDFGSYSGGERGLEHQDKVTNRLSIYVEKKDAPKDRVLGDSELEQFIINTGRDSETFSLGHDFRACDLARFFTQCQKQGIGNEEELKLRSVLVENRFIKRNKSEVYEAISDKALITFSEEQIDNPSTKQYDGGFLWRRRVTLSHELGHGEYFTNENYRKYSKNFWNEKMNESDRKAFLKMLNKMGYDSENKDLIINEMQAGLVHTPFSWFSRSIDMHLERLEELKKEFLTESPVGSFFR